MKKITAPLLFIAAIIFVLCGCKFGTSGSWANNSIDAQVRSEIKELNTSLFKAFAAKDLAGAKKIMSAELLKATGNGIDTVVNMISEQVNDPEFAVVDEYYTKNTATNINNTVLSTHGTESDYVVTYLALNKDMYVSLLTPANNDLNFLVLIIYGKYDDGWKINILRAGDYSYFGKKAPQFYEQALKQYDKKHVIDAALSMVLASRISRPAAEHFKYKKDTEMQLFFESAIKQANTQYQFPLTVQGVKNKPQIISVNPQYIGEEGEKGFYPLIAYLSSIKLTDTVALKAENDEMQKTIGTVFNGIDKNNKVIIYKAYNEIPNGKEAVSNYGFIQKFK